MYNNKILIADDDPNLIDYYISIFEENEELDFFEEKNKISSQKFDLKLFNDGKPLYEYFKKEYELGNKLPLVILDMRMPEMNGLETAQKLREIDPDIIIVIVTAFSDVSHEDIRRKLYDNIYYFKKPFDEVELFALVTSLCKNWNQKRSLVNGEARLKNQKNLFEAILESTPALVYLKDKDLKYIKCNRAFCKLLNMSNNELEGKTDYDLFPKEHAKFYEKDDLMVLTTGEPVRNRTEILEIDNNNNRLWLDTTRVPFKDYNNEIVGIVVTSLDITGRKNAEDKLKKSMAELERFNNLMLGREERVLNLKKEVNDLLQELDRKPVYKTAGVLGAIK